MGTPGAKLSEEERKLIGPRNPRDIVLTSVRQNEKGDVWVVGYYPASSGKSQVEIVNDLIDKGLISTPSKDEINRFVREQVSNFTMDKKDAINSYKI